MQESSHNAKMPQRFAYVFTCSISLAGSGGTDLSTDIIDLSLVLKGVSAATPGSKSKLDVAFKYL